jgi:hypothetical protein
MVFVSIDDEVAFAVEDNVLLDDDFRLRDNTLRSVAIERVRTAAHRDGVANASFSASKSADATSLLTGARALSTRRAVFDRRALTHSAGAHGGGTLVAIVARRAVFDRRTLTDSAGAHGGGALNAIVARRAVFDRRTLTDSAGAHGGSALIVVVVGARRTVCNRGELTHTADARVSGAFVVVVAPDAHTWIAALRAPHRRNHAKRADTYESV